MTDAPPPPIPPESPAMTSGWASVVPAAFSSRCPRCSTGPLFDGWIGFAPSCRACGLSYEQFNVGDGPAAFLILILGALVTMFAVVLQIAASPPFWVHVLLWVPLTTAAVILSLRVSKAALLILEYRNQAREGRIVGNDIVGSDPAA